MNRQILSICIHPLKRAGLVSSTQISEMSIERVNFVAVYLNPNLYAIGGWNTSTTKWN